MRKLKNFTQHVFEGAVLSKGIDFMKLEEICATTFQHVDFLPSNIREWEKVVNQLERLKKLYKAYIVDGKSITGFDPRIGGGASVTEYILNGDEFKHSLLEIKNDIFSRATIEILKAFKKCNFPIDMVDEMCKDLYKEAKQEKDRYGDVALMDSFVKNGLAKKLAASIKALDKFNDKIESGWDFDGKTGHNPEWFVHNKLGIDYKKGWLDLKDLTDIYCVAQFSYTAKSSSYDAAEKMITYKRLCHTMNKLGISIPDAISMYKDIIEKANEIFKDNWDNGLEKAFGNDYFIMPGTADSLFSIPELKKMKASGKTKLIIEKLNRRERPIPYEYFSFIDEIRIMKMTATGPEDRAMEFKLISEIPAGKTLFVNSPVLKIDTTCLGKIKMPKDSVVYISSYAADVSKIITSFGNTQKFAYSNDSIKDKLIQAGITEDRIVEYNEWKHAREATHPGSYDNL